MKRVLAFCLSLIISSSVWAAGKELLVYNWSEYLPDSVLEKFTGETGIQVTYSTFDSNEAMYAKVRLLQGKGYDVLVPSTYYVSKMREEGLLLELDKSRLPNLSNLDPNLLDQDYDPGNTYSFPYLWGSTGIAVNTDMLEEGTITRWADLWDPSLEGELLLHNDVREVFQVALSVLGFSGNTTNPEEIEAAYEKLKSLMPNVRLFDSDSPKDTYLSGEASAGMIWNGDGYVVAEENPAIRFIYPAEGAIFWVDSLVIPKQASNPENAHTFINFLMRPDIAAEIAEEIGYSTPNLKGLALLPEEVRSDQTISPGADLINQGEFQSDVGEAILEYQKFWELLKVGR